MAADQLGGTIQNKEYAAPHLHLLLSRPMMRLCANRSLSWRASAPSAIMPRLALDALRRAARCKPHQVLNHRTYAVAFLAFGSPLRQAQDVASTGSGTAVRDLLFVVRFFARTAKKRTTDAMGRTIAKLVIIRATPAVYIRSVRLCDFRSSRDLIRLYRHKHSANLTLIMR